MKKNIIIMTLFFVFIRLIVYSQEKEYKLDEIIVTTNRTPITFSNLSRTVTVLSYNEIKHLPVTNVQDLLQYVNAVDLKVRGVEGVQADAGIRGGTFEQTLILIDGIKVSDSQTGHHNLNLPITIDNIERIEILKGHGSRIFGPNAFAGAVNIITKKSRDKSLSISAIGGQHNLYEISFYSSYPILTSGNNVSFSKRKSDGYRDNTNFDITTFSIGQNISINKNVVNLYFGYIDKKFGAYNFYSDLFPNQWERTITKILNVSAELGNSDFNLIPKIYWRRNDDDYILDKTRPNWYHNIHKTNSYGLEIQSSLKTSIGTTSLGSEINKDEIESTNLGNHNRTKGGFFVEHLYDKLENFTFSAGVYVYNYSNIGWKFWPGIDACYKITPLSKIFASYGKAFRIPTFTELYYKSPANMGNPNLKHEETTNYEIGFSTIHRSYFAEVSLFYKNGYNIIDWGRISKGEPWRVDNISNVKTYGTELNIQIFPKQVFSELPVNKIEFNYTYLTMNRTTGKYESKYLLDHLKHHLLINVNHNLPFNIDLSWFFRFEKRINFDSFFIVDSQLNYKIKKLSFFMRATNLFNKSYSDFTGVPLPGRWITAGVKYNLI
ncbi:MAG: TonB-dependent receptor [Melioribacter sp.]|nr:TonB-dependent receptor [Melioribacter sp.]